MRGSKSVKQYAFWKHDVYPYVLGGEVTEMSDEGHVRAHGWGSYWFKPFKIVPLRAGRIFKRALEKLQDGERKAQKVHGHEWTAKVAALFPERFECK